jgi:hypothetical protein
MSAALGITPPDDDKLFPIEALDLEPHSPVGLVPAIDGAAELEIDPDTTPGNLS